MQEGSGPASGSEQLRAVPRVSGVFNWYRGWTMVGLGIVMVMLSVGSVIYGYSIYITPVSEELGLSRETVNGGIVFQHVGTALLTPLIGHMLDRVKVSTIVFVSGLCLGGGLIGMGIGDALLPKAALLALPISFGFSGAGSIASYVLVARWFKLHRGRAMAIVALGQSGGSVVLAPIIGMLIASVGWRQALLVQGIFVGVALVLIAWGMVDRPGPNDREPAGKAVPVPESDLHDDGAPGKPLTMREVASSPLFWALAAIVALTLSVVTASIASLVPLATGRGITLVKASALISMLGVSGLLGKVALAVIADRVSRLTLISIAIVIIMVFTFSLTQDLGYAGLAAICIMGGLAIAGFWPIYSALLADVFGAHSLGTTEGLVAPVISLMSAGTIYLAGVTFDATGDYRLIFTIFTGALAVAFVLSVALRFFGGQHNARPEPAHG